MKKDDLQKSIRHKRNVFLLGIIAQFQQSDENKSLFDCYDYVKIVTETTIDSFLNNLTNEERIIIENKLNNWFIPLESIRTFSVFLSNNNVALNE